MAASSNDKLSKTSSGGIASVATVISPRSPGVLSLSVDTQLNWPTDTGIKFSTYRVDSSNVKVPGTQIDWKGVSNGTNTLSNIVRTGGATDTGNLAGDKVVMYITAQWGEDIVEAMLTSHTQTGSLLPAAVQTAIGSGSIVYANFLSTIFGGQVTTYVNPGTAAGTFYYINLGGIRLFWGATGSTLTAGGAVGTVTLPVGFFTTIQSTMLTAGIASGTAAVSAVIQALSTSSLDITLNAWTGGGTMPVQVFMVGK